MSLSIPIEKLESLPDLLGDLSSSEDGTYAIKCERKVDASADDEEVQSQVWFETESLDATAIGRIESLQLFAKSRDQGWSSAPDAGNWTWFEFAIMEAEHKDHPRFQDAVKLVWTSHNNRREDGEDYGWTEGPVLDNSHDLFRSLKPGNVIAVRVCARFQGWAIHAKAGCLVVKLGPLKHNLLSSDRTTPPPPYAKIVSRVKNIQDTISQVNGAVANIAFEPSLPATFYRADVFESTNEPALRVLALDGGGVRGLSSLYLLKAVMNKVHPGKKPCEVFDMIGGTSTGGLIAIMLGRLGMDVDECIDKYKTFMGKIFAPGWWSTITSAAEGVRYDKTVLEKVIKGLVQETLRDGDAKLLDDGNKCKVFVMAVQEDAVNNRAPIFLRSYTNPLEMSALPGVKIWEAARATSAAPTYFKAIKVGGIKLVDGGLGANNPLGWLWTEVLSVFGPARATNCFLSIGTGLSKNIGIHDGLTGLGSIPGALSGVATNSELINILFRNLIDAYAPTSMTRKYWRLNVGTEVPEKPEDIQHLFGVQNYADVGELDDLKIIGRLTEVTELYIKAQDEVIDQVAQALMAK